jgi:exopolyphosphatase/guanosine-5'-triphosphate,3'-diphosphate pyrophosphatase
LAVIYLGANGITLLIAEMGADREVRPIELMTQPVALAQEVFRHGVVSGEAMERAVQILQSYQQAMREYGVAGPPARVVATNLILEAQNQDTLLNRIDVAFGWKAEMLNDGEMTRLIYLAARRLLKKSRKLADRGVLVSHIGPGNTRALLFQDGGIANYHRYQLGIERTREQVEQTRGDLTVNARVISQHTRNVFEQMGFDFGGPAARQFVAIGHEIQVVGQLLARSSGGARVLPVRKLAGLVAEIDETGPDRLARRLQLDFRTADLLLYALQLHLDLAGQFGFQELIVPDEDFEMALLAAIVSPASAPDRFRKEVGQAALNLAKKFKIDTGHAEHVARLSAVLFQELEPLHALGWRESLILTAAALLHETGHLIGSRDHHLHSMYIIQHNEIFGLDQDDTILAALVARYHRGVGPSLEHQEYRLLDRSQRLAVSKLAALLRVADALDRGRGQRVTIRRVIREGGRLILEISGVKDTAAVQLAMNSKAGLFNSVFGLEVVLQVATGVAVAA